MSRNPYLQQPVVEWSPLGARFAGGASSVTSGKSVGALAGLPQSGMVVLALSRRAAFIRPLRVPNASADEVQRAIGLQIGQLFPLAGKNLTFAFRLTSDVTAEGRLAIVAACATEILEKARAELADVGLHHSLAVPTAFGSAQIAASEGLSDCAIVERTQEGIAIDIVSGGELRATRVIPDTSDPEEIKGEVCRTFTVAGIKCGPIVACNGLLLEGADRSLAASPLGFLAAGGATKVGVHLELPEIAARKSQAQTARKSRLSMLALVAAVVCLAVAVTGRMNKVRRVQQSDSAYATQLKKLNLEKSAAISSGRKHGQTAAVLKSAFEPAQYPSEVLRLVANSVPKDVWITGFSFDRGKLSFVRGSAVRNEAVVEYLDALTALSDPETGAARFREVKIAFANNGKIENAAIVNFSIQLFPVGNVPIVEGKAAKK
ncbi:MAG: PilN domain-containing protein [Armatimonadetes bacterium]|nr:PilN domain-containing protein [Armatimonadota bacterium]